MRRAYLPIIFGKENLYERTQSSKCRAKSKVNILTCIEIVGKVVCHRNCDKLVSPQ